LQADGNKLDEVVEVHLTIRHRRWKKEPAECEALGLSPSAEIS